MFKRNFSRLNGAIIIIILLLIGSFVVCKKTKKSVPSKGESGEITVVSDVDAHSQSQMKITVEGDSVTAIQGDPTDPESKGELNIRDKKMKEILYAPDR